MIWPERVISCLIWILLYFTLFVTKAWSKIIFKNQKSSQSIWDSYQPTSTSPRRSHQDIHSITHTTKSNAPQNILQQRNVHHMVWQTGHGQTKTARSQCTDKRTRKPCHWNSVYSAKWSSILHPAPFLGKILSLLQLLVFASHWTRCNWQHTLVKALQPALAKLNIASTKLTLTSINLDFCKSSRG